MTYPEFSSIADELQPLAEESMVDRECRSWKEIHQKSQGANISTVQPLYWIASQSFFKEDSAGWNLSKFTGAQSVIHALPKNEWFDGIQTEYSYFGMFGTSFAWHREDRNLCSINYVHAGDPKLWYGIAQDDTVRFENIIQAEVEKLSLAERKRSRLNCSSIIRHKIAHAPPSFLKENNIPFGKVSSCSYCNVFLYMKH